MLFFNNRPQVARNYDSLNNGIDAVVNYPQSNKENQYKPLLEQHQIVYNLLQFSRQFSCLLWVMDYWW